MSAYSNILAWRILWIEEPGGLQSIGSHRVRHNRRGLAHTHILIFLNLEFSGKKEQGVASHNQVRQFPSSSFRHIKRSIGSVKFSLNVFSPEELDKRQEINHPASFEGDMTWTNQTLQKRILLGLRSHSCRSQRDTINNQKILHTRVMNLLLDDLCFCFTKICIQGKALRKYICLQKKNSKY